MSYLEEIHSITSIVGGSPADLGRFPFQAAILQNGFQFCGGSLISPNVVLTAAHCAEVTATHVALGCVNINNLNNCEVISVTSRSVFPNFNSDGFLSGDFQLLGLERESIQTPVTIAAPGFDLEAGQDLTVIGWGAIDPATQQNSGGILLEADVESVSQDSCDDQYKDLIGIQNNFPRPFTGTVVNDFKFCASADGTDSCQGDSGGPIFLRCDATGEDLQVGVVSFGFGCAYDGIPGVYASVFQPEAFEFIESIVDVLGHSLQTIGNSSEFCVVGGTQPSEELSDPPTPFPTFDLNGWICQSSFFAANDGCDCECGILDPDCEFHTVVFNCLTGESCINGVCVRPPTAFPTAFPTSSPTAFPTAFPTRSPTFPAPTRSPTSFPTTSPTTTSSPTNFPSRSPVEAPTRSPIPGESFVETLFPFGVEIGVGMLVGLMLLLVAVGYTFSAPALKHEDVSKPTTIDSSKEVHAGEKII